MVDDFGVDVAIIRHIIAIIRLILNFLTVWLKLLKPGGVRAIAAENAALRKQLIILSRHHKRAPKLTTTHRMIFGFLTSMMSPKRLLRTAIVLKRSTLLKFHKALVQRKHQLLF